VGKSLACPQLEFPPYDGHTRGKAKKENVMSKQSSITKPPRYSESFKEQILSLVRSGRKPVPGIHVQLRQEGTVVNHKRIARLMRIEGLHSMRVGGVVVAV
jgi:transposase InsO family protein